MSASTWTRERWGWRLLAQRRDVWWHFGFNVRIPRIPTLNPGLTLNLGVYCVELSRLPHP